MNSKEGCESVNFSEQEEELSTRPKVCKKKIYWNEIVLMQTALIVEKHPDFKYNAELKLLMDVGSQWIFSQDILYDSEVIKFKTFKTEAITLVI